MLGEQDLYFTEHLSADDFGTLLEFIRKRYGFDFSGYAVNSLARRIVRFMEMHKMADSASLGMYLDQGPDYFYSFLAELTVGVTEFFRDPKAWEFLRQRVLPQLRSVRPMDIWCAGCASGEEVLSLSILLQEENIIDRRILGTDINPVCLDTASQYTYGYRKLELYQRNYKATGGTRDLRDYFTIESSNAVAQKNLMDRTQYLTHNLVSDSSPGKFHLILCRNVLIYFDAELQEKVLALIAESLHDGGIVMFGNYESLIWSRSINRFNPISQELNIYQKVR